MSPPKTARILVVDDSPQQVVAIGSMLSDHYTATFATSGPAALETVASAPPPDLILLDVGMPEMDGYAVCAALKADAATRDIPVIFVTARADPESESRALAAGGLDFIHKPVEAAVLRARVGLHLALRQQTQALAQANAALAHQARALSAANAELARHRDRLDERVHERTQALAAALDAAESAHRAKSAFLANMSHELRTPINQIMGLGYLLGKHGQGPQAPRYLDGIQQASRGLLALVNDVLTYAASEAETLCIAASDFALSGVLAQAQDSVRTAAQAKGCALICESDPGLPDWFRGDPRRLGQVLGQLLDNAVKFSETGPVTLRVRQGQTHPDALTLRFEVQDRGIGIPAERQSTLFRLFEQGDNSLSRQHRGTGLGLALCQRLVTLMGGALGVTSAPGAGSTFWLDLRLPLGQAPTAPASPVSGPDPAPLIGELAQRLAVGDWTALPLWDTLQPHLRPVLGEHAGAFQQAIEALNLEEALCLLLASGATALAPDA